MRILLSAVLLVASAAAADETPAVTVKEVAGNAHLSAAMRLYQKLDLDAALAELQLAEVDAKDSQDQMVQVLIYRGLIYSETGKQTEASDHFKRALAMQPWADVPADTSPRIAKSFADARRSLWGMAAVRPPQKRAAAPSSATDLKSVDLGAAPPASSPAPADKK